MFHSKIIDGKMSILKNWSFHMERKYYAYFFLSRMALNRMEKILKISVPLQFILEATFSVPMSKSEGLQT